MDNKQNAQLFELTDYDYRDIRKSAFARYFDLEKKRDARHEREAQWDTNHWLDPISRWFVNWVRSIKDNRDEDEMQEALDWADPIAGFSRWKARKQTQR